jgi:hypothetical protein
MPNVKLIPTKAYRNLPQGTSPTAYSRSIIIEVFKRYSGNNIKADDRRMASNIIEAVDDAITANANAANVDLTNPQIAFLKTCFLTINTTIDEAFNFYQFERALP